MRQILSLIILFSLLISSCASAQPISEKPSIVILATGGTIAGNQASSNVNYEAGVLEVGVLIDAVPALTDIANISGVQVANVGSQDMNENIWFDLATKISELQKNENIDGFVITHGTDTIEETAFFLDLVFPVGKPIVLTGSMRSSDAISADGPKNLYDAVKIASSQSSSNRGAMVALNGKIHSARLVKKNHTENLEAFSSGLNGLLGEIQNGKIKYFKSKRTAKINNFLELKSPGEINVGVVYSYAGTDASLIDFYKDKGFDGIILAGVGNGNSNAATIKAIEENNSKLITVRSSRVLNGVISRNVEINDNEIGTIASYDLNPQKSRILLDLLLSRTKNKELIQRSFECEIPLYTNYCE